MSVLFFMFVFGIVDHVSTFDMILARPNVTYMNHKYLDWCNFTVVRYGRRSPYFLNIEGRFKHAWGNNVTVNLVFYELLSNEYRRSFVEFHFPLCKLVEQEAYVGGLLAKGFAGKTCPYPAGEYRLMNLTVPSPKVNFVWPFTHARANIYVQTTPNNDTIVTGFLFVTIK